MVYLTATSSEAASSIDTSLETVCSESSGVRFLLRVAAKLKDKPNAAKVKGCATCLCASGIARFDSCSRAQRADGFLLSARLADTISRQRCHRLNDSLVNIITCNAYRCDCACRSTPKPANPFLPYDEILWVAHLSSTHTLLLNKFNVVAHHTLVVTRKFERQEEQLSAQDLEATMAVLAVCAAVHCVLCAICSGAGAHGFVLHMMHIHGAITVHLARASFSGWLMYLLRANGRSHQAHGVLRSSASHSGYPTSTDTTHAPSSGDSRRTPAGASAGIPSRRSRILQPRSALRRQPAAQAPASGAAAARAR